MAFADFPSFLECLSMAKALVTLLRHGLIKDIFLSKWKKNIIKIY